jgi:uncharacterized domain 1
MSFEELVTQAGGLKSFFEALRKKGVNLEEELQKQLSQKGSLFEAMGFKLEKFGEGEVELSFSFSERIARRGGIVHGGVVMYSLDSAAGLAVMSLNEGVDQLTIELKVNFLEPLKHSPFKAKGRVLRMGSATAVAEGEVIDAKGTLCAKALGTWFLVKKGLQTPSNSFNK